MYTALSDGEILRRVAFSLFFPGKKKIPPSNSDLLRVLGYIFTIEKTGETATATLPGERLFTRWSMKHRCVCPRQKRPKAGGFPHRVRYSLGQGHVMAWAFSPLPPLPDVPIPLKARSSSRTLHPPLLPLSSTQGHRPRELSRNDEPVTRAKRARQDQSRREERTPKESRRVRRG